MHYSARVVLPIAALLSLLAAAGLFTCIALADGGIWGMGRMMDGMGDMHGMMGGSGLETTGVASGQGPVRIVDFSFQPTVLTVTPGTRVTWTNEDSAPHTATGDSFDTGRLNQGGSAPVTFDTPGEFRYKCEYHPSMVGRVVVSDGVSP